MPVVVVVAVVVVVVVGSPFFSAINSDAHAHTPPAVEKGGEDLFEFFDKHIEGVDISTARQIVLGIVLPTAYLHGICICHRDLKPENILLKSAPDQKINSSHIQICDFGLCHSSEKNAQNLTDFCGSPGFFAPEMIISKDGYNGQLVDVWSIGCILLELLLGHDNFCKSWMTAYDFDIIRRPSTFEDSINDAVNELNLTHLTKEVQHFISEVSK